MTKQTKKTSGWSIVGAGSMGCLWACKLSEIGHPVRLIVRNSNALTEYQSLGKLILESNGTTSFYDAQVSCVDQLNESLDKVLITTKAHDTLQAFEDIKPLLAKNSEILLLQNGIEVQKKITKENPELSIYCLTTSQGVWQKKRFHSVHAGNGETWIGRLHHARPDHRTNALMESLPINALRICWDDDIKTRLWIKLAVNCVINCLTVIYECKNGDLLKNDAPRTELVNLAREVELIINTIESVRPISNLVDQVQEIATTTANNYSSMLQDFKQGRATEINHFNGFLCRQAALKKIPCALNVDILNRVLIKVDSK